MHRSRRTWHFPRATHGIRRGNARREGGLAAWSTASALPMRTKRDAPSSDGTVRRLMPARGWNCVPSSTSRSGASSATQTRAGTRLPILIEIPYGAGHGGSPTRAAREVERARLPDIRRVGRRARPPRESSWRTSRGSFGTRQSVLLGHRPRQPRRRSWGHCANR